ncbi:MAG: hypothetical protein AUG88_01600 [Actinobacteria bacterium 13_1_20CM_4_68_12]|nr:MAG: hypothetical protein AUG88_01600 [Actinobacteria bacterium 13_1_20CM_4_68_12]
MAEGSEIQGEAEARGAPEAVGEEAAAAQAEAGEGAEAGPVSPESGGVVVVSPLPGSVVSPLSLEPPEPGELPAPGLVSLAGGVSAGWLVGA